VSSRVAEKSCYAFNHLKVDGSVRLHTAKDVIEGSRSQTSMSDETLETRVQPLLCGSWRDMKRRGQDAN
jgi:hypothetical protein